MSEVSPLRRPLRRYGWGTLVVLAALLVQGGLHAKRGARRGMRPTQQIVSVAVTTRGDMPVKLHELGTITPLATVTLLPRLSGYLTAVAYGEGQFVRKGQLLAQIDPRPYQLGKLAAQAQLAKDRSSLAQAQSELARYAFLAASKSIAEQTYEDQRFTVQQDDAAVRADLASVAQYDLDIMYCRMTAPVSGRVGLRLVDPGNYVTASSSTGIAVITQMKPTTVEFSVPQTALSDVMQHYDGASMRVDIYSADNDRQLASGAVVAMNNQVAAATGTVTFRVALPNEDGSLYPGEFVNVSLIVTTLRDVVLVPTAAIASDAAGDFIYVVDSDHKVSVHRIVPGPGDGISTTIESGLAPGQRVVSDGLDRLYDGAIVRIAGGHDVVGNLRPRGPGPGFHHWQQTGVFQELPGAMLLRRHSVPRRAASDAE